jgi:signal transduction histidine kinase
LIALTQVFGRKFSCGEINNEFEMEEQLQQVIDLVNNNTHFSVEEKKVVVDAFERQRRALEIDAALDAVRDRTMAMQGSHELAETVSLVFNQLVRLGIRISQMRTCAIVTLKPDEPIGECWITSPQGDVVPKSFMVSYGEGSAYQPIYEAWKKGEQFFVVHLSGEALARHLSRLKQLAKIPTQVYQASPDQPNETFTHALFFSQGYLLIISNESLAAYHDIFKRFGAVFQQTYTRFLDLKLAEEQTREAKIETALERVRTKAMAMQKSEDLAAAVEIVFEELDKLSMGTIRCGISIINRENHTTDIWSTTKTENGLSLQVSGDESMDIHPLLQGAFNAWLNHQDFSYALSGDDLKKFYSALAGSNFRLPDAPDDPGQEQYMFVAHFPAGGLYVFKGTDFSLEAKKIIKRFAEVFNLTYTRFRDLKLAEAQARESRIEAALERVRGKAMSMHRSEDLPGTINLFYHELETLSVTPRRCGVGLVDQETRISEISTVNFTGEGTSIEILGHLKLAGHPLLDALYYHWTRQEEYHPILRGNEIRDYYQLIRPQISYPDYPGDQVQYGYFFNFGEGGVFAWTEKELAEDELKIYRRFTAVLSLTYKRYKDLKDAEARTLMAQREASLDRVRAEIASMRNTEDLQRITPLLWRELTALGVPFFRCGLMIVEEKEKKTDFYLSSPDGKPLAALYLSFDSFDFIRNCVNSWRSQNVYTDHWDRDQFAAFTGALISQGQIRTASEYQQGEQPPDSLTLQFVPFTQGMLYVGSNEALLPAQIDLVRSIAGAFATAYARYEDFIRLETAKQQVEHTLSELRATQSQLIQSEKMASLGELTAGIAHEIQNPLNFVNNFSEVNAELVAELQEELNAGKIENALSIANDIKENEEKISHHGKRADAIVKGMLQHSRSSTGQKELTDFNALADEYLRLSYHGLRAKNKEFNASFKTDFDADIGKINIAAQDISRVLLNLYNNAFYAVDEKKKLKKDGYEPVVSVSTKKTNTGVIVMVSDNGSGIPEKILDKIFQPFFTTKPTGQGTGLGLSLSYDIIKSQEGSLSVETKEGEGSIFTIDLPVK